MWKDRLRNVKSLMEERGYESLLLSPGPNLRYLTGFHLRLPVRGFWDSLRAWNPVSIIPLNGDPVLIVSKDSKDWAEAVSQIDDIRYYSDAKNRKEILKGLISNKGTLGIEEHLPSVRYEQLTAVFPQIKMKNASEMLYEVRMIKSKEEIALIRKAVEIVEKGIWAGREVIQESITEIEIWGEIEGTMLKHGAESVAFCVVQTGAMPRNSYFPPSKNRVKKGDFVLMDVCASYKGYHADITRMTIVGKPSEEQEEAYNAVVEAQSKALDAIRDGVKAMATYEAAKRVIDERGYGKYFEGLGHGLGLELHEAPPWGWGGDWDYREKAVLKAGMVVTIEPSISPPGKFVIQVEDDVLVTEGGKEILSTIGKELYQV